MLYPTMEEKLFPQCEDPNMENLLIDDHSPEATFYLSPVFGGGGGGGGGMTPCRRETAPDSSHASNRHLLIKRRLSGLEKSASGYSSLHRMDADLHGMGYCPAYPSDGEIQPHLLPVPLVGYSSSASFEGQGQGQGHGSSLSEHSWPDHRYGYLSGAQSPGSTSFQSSVQYREMVHSPAAESLHGLHANCHSSVSPRDVQRTPDLELVPLPSPCSTQFDSMTLQQPPAFSAQSWSLSTGKDPERYEPGAASPAVRQTVVVDPALEEDQAKSFRHPRPLHPRARQSPIAVLSPTYPLHATSPPSSPPPPLSPESRASNNEFQNLLQSTKHRGSKSCPPRRGTRGKRSTSRAQRRRLTDKVLFECTFAPYGCPRTFSAKNEWKRHVSTIHLQLETFYCSLDGCGPCRSPESSVIPHVPTSPKPYNRKDLFTQHLRRMHAPWTQPYKPTAEDEAEFEEEIKQIQERSCVRRREPPQQSQCPFCKQEFAGPQCWDRRMEHVSGHYERHDDRQKREDVPLRDWAFKEGILKVHGRRWVLADPPGVRKRTG